MMGQEEERRGRGEATRALCIGGASSSFSFSSSSSSPSLPFPSFLLPTVRVAVVAHVAVVVEDVVSLPPPFLPLPRPLF